MKKIKEKLIHLLGGKTPKDEQRLVYEIVCHTRYLTMYRVRTYLDLMNGAPADLWCKMVYDYVKRIEKNWEASAVNDEMLGNSFETIKKVVEMDVKTDIENLKL